MKTHVGITLIALTLIIFTGFLTNRTIQAAKDDQWKYANTLSRFKEVNAELDSNLFRFSLFLLKNYDPLVSGSQELKKLTGHLSTESKSYEVSPFSEKLDGAVSRKLEAIEKFKSKNAILRNSRAYIATLGEELLNESREAGGRNTSELVGLSWLVNKYLRTKNPEDLAQSQKLLKKIGAGFHRTGPITSALEELSVHLSILEKNDASAAEYFQSATSLEIESIVRVLEKSYQEEIRKRNSASVWYQRIILSVLVLVFGYCLTILWRLWKTMERLEESNNHLEERVQLRTKELEESAEIIRAQQKSLVHSSKMSALGEMAGGIAHEINNPLAIITLNCKTILKKFQKSALTPEEAIEHIQQIQETVNRISSIVKGLRTFSREGAVSDMKPTHLGEMVGQTLALCKDKYREQDINLINLVPENLPIVECNPVSISQVLLNLLNNAADAVSPLEERWVKVEAWNERTEMVITVTDSGKGIPPEIAAKLMQPFFTTKEVGKGTGLGLSISKGIVEGHGGKFSLDQEHANTRFIIRIPCSQIKAA